jgi:hypothetical protein
MKKMDDQKFDDIIKSKVGDYEERGFDPASLASLHHQMAMQSAVPWYVSRRSELITVSVVAFATLLILMTQWYLYRQQAQILKDEIMSLISDRKEVESMQLELDHLKNITTDTIRIIEIRQERSSEYIMLQQRLRSLEYEIQKLADRQQFFISDETNPGLTDEGPGNIVYETHAGHSRSTRLVPRNDDDPGVHARRDDRKQSKTTAINLSAKTIRDIEKHYQNGVGIKIGPTLEPSNGIYSQGSGQFTIGYGVLADFILSPSVSLETGAKYFRRNYALNDINELNKISWPGADESLGELHKVEVDNMMLEIPLNLKYRYPLSLKTHWLGSIGYSPTLYLNQVFEYEYKFDDGSGGNSFMIHSTYRDNKITLYPGTLNFSIGISNQLKNRKTVETTLFYQQGLGDMGAEKMRTKYFGVRGIYWFNVK